MARPLMEVTIEGDDVAAMLRLAGKHLPDEMTKLMTRAALLVQETAKTEFIRTGSAATLGTPLGPPLPDMLTSRTGALRSAIQVRPLMSEVAALVGVGSSIKYGRIHELGGVIHRPEIRPRPPRKALRFVIGGVVVFAKRVRAMTIKMPKRPYLWPAYLRRKPDIHRLVVVGTMRLLEQAIARAGKLRITTR